MCARMCACVLSCERVCVPTQAFHPHDRIASSQAAFAARSAIRALSKAGSAAGAGALAVLLAFCQMVAGAGALAVLLAVCRGCPWPGGGG